MNRQDIVIREASNDDCERVINLVSSVLDEFQLPFEPDSKDAELADIEIMYIQAGGWFEVIEDKSGRLLGTYGLFPLTDMTCEFRKMYFLPEIRRIRLARDISERAVRHAPR